MAQRGTQFRNSAERGEWAEIRFVARAAEQLFRVSKPWGNTAPYDLMVERDGIVYRVQVKSTINRTGAASYGCTMPQGKRRIHLLSEVDFVAAYVIPADIWYIIPVGAVQKCKGVISLSPWKRNSKYERYLESWYLLRHWRGSRRPTARQLPGHPRKAGVSRISERRSEPRSTSRHST